MLILPLTGHEIPLIADEHADMAFGTGCVKITPAHDPNDFEVGQRHNLPSILVLNGDGTINQNGGKYEGMDRYEARRAIVRDLEEGGYLVKIEPHKHNVGSCYRCHNTVEPMTSNQWFVKMKPLAEPALECVRNGDTKFVPERFTKIYTNWMENVHDWCISRQLWWGHRIPAFYCDKCGEMVVSKTDVDTCPKCGAKNASGGGRTRHLVLVRALALLDARLARQDRRPRLLLSDERACHRLRYHLLLGRAHDLLGARAHRKGTVRARVHPRSGSRRAGKKDVEIARQRRRPACR